MTDKQFDASHQVCPCKMRSRNSNRLKDEVYRQMFRLEESRPGSELGLAMALLRAWLAGDGNPASIEDSDWLKKVSPIGLQMIEKSLQTRDTAHRHER